MSHPLTWAGQWHLARHVFEVKTKPLYVCTRNGEGKQEGTRRAVGQRPGRALAGPPALGLPLVRWNPGRKDTAR